MSSAGIGRVRHGRRVDALVGVAEQRRSVAGPTGQPGDVVEAVLEGGPVGHHPVVHLVHAGVERRPTRGARRGLAVVGGEADPLGGQPVEVRGRTSGCPAADRQSARNWSSVTRSTFTLPTLAVPSGRTRIRACRPGAAREVRRLAAHGAPRRPDPRRRPVGDRRRLPPARRPPRTLARDPRGARVDRAGRGTCSAIPGIRSDSDMFTMGYSFRPWEDARGHRRRPLDPRVHPRDRRQPTGSRAWIRFSQRAISAQLVLRAGALDGDRASAPTPASS